MYWRYYRLLNMWSDKCLTSSVSEDPSTSNMVIAPTYCWNLKASTFIIFIDRGQDIWFRNKFISKLLRMFVIALNADDKCSFLIRNNVKEPIQIQLFKKQKLFLDLFLHFWNWDQVLNFFKKTWSSYLMYFGNYRLRKKWLGKSLKSTVSEEPLTSDMIIGPKHCWNLKASNFSVFIYDGGSNWVRKSLS